MAEKHYYGKGSFVVLVYIKIPMSFGSTYFAGENICSFLETAYLLNTPDNYGEENVEIQVCLQPKNVPPPTHYVVSKNVLRI